MKNWVKAIIGVGLVGVTAVGGYFLYKVLNDEVDDFDDYDDEDFFDDTDEDFWEDEDLDDLEDLEDLDGDEIEIE